ncbi:NHL repeat-containing protein [Mucilaginibacter sp.]|uniref:NHL repeat-containing protein n=1 Tax=Mucilaginibacter sp. TaxID=1882438 RepID=UPI003D0C724F
MKKNFTHLNAITLFSVFALLNFTACSKKSDVNTGGTPANYSGSVTTLAGGGGGGSATGSKNGSDTSATFYFPSGIAVDASLNVYVADAGNNMIRMISPTGVVTTLAGTVAKGRANGTGTAATFSYPYAIAIDASGNLYVADEGNNLIRKITAGGVVSTLAGSGQVGSANGPGSGASFYDASGIAVDGSGNVYVADQGNNLIRKITPAGVVSTLAGSGASGSQNGTGTAASFYAPTSVAVDATGNVYVADSFNNMIRKITPDGVVSTFAGSGTAGATNGTGTAATFNNPQGLNFDVEGNLYVADYTNNQIRKISPAGVVTTFAGSGASGDINGALSLSTYSGPTAVAVDKLNTAYVADHNNHLIRKLKP